MVGLLLGAGLPALVALGMRSLAMGTGDGTTGVAEHGGRTSAAGRLGAALCFAIVGLAVVAGLIVLTASKAFLAKFGLS